MKHYFYSLILFSCLLIQQAILYPTNSTEKPIIRLNTITMYTNSKGLASIGYDNCDMANNGEYAIMNIIQDGDIVFDIGANKGEWSQHVLNHKTGITLHACEPLQEVYKQLKANLKRYSVICHNFALSNETTQKNFYCYNAKTSASELSSLFHRPILDTLLHAKPTIISVETKTLDSLCQEQSVEHIDFLKIDTEGAELNVLKGAANLLKTGAIKIIQFEYGGTYSDAHITLKEVHELLINYGYLIFRIIPLGLVDITEWTSSLENYRYSNYLAVYNR